MSTALIVSGVSAVWVFFWTLIFWYEDSKGRRVFLVGVRGLVDTVVARFAAIFGRLFSWWGSGRVRLFLHFIVHTVLRSCLRSVRWMEQWVESLLRHNKRRAKKVQQQEVSQNSAYLSEVAKHKADTSPRAQRKH